MKKIILVSVAIMFLVLGGTARASVYLPEGSAVKTGDSPDVYIVKYVNGQKYKRLIVNPQVFESYQNLSWDNIITISQEEMDSLKTSYLVQLDGSVVVWSMSPYEDDCELYLLTNFRRKDAAVYTINDAEFGLYPWVGVDDGTESRN